MSIRNEVTLVAIVAGEYASIIIGYPDVVIDNSEMDALLQTAAFAEWWRLNQQSLPRRINDLHQFIHQLFGLRKGDCSRILISWPPYASRIVIREMAQKNQVDDAVFKLWRKEGISIPCLLGTDGTAAAVLVAGDSVVQDHVRLVTNEVANSLEVLEMEGTLGNDMGESHLAITGNVSESCNDHDSNVSFSEEDAMELRVLIRNILNKAASFDNKNKIGYVLQKVSVA